MKIGDIFRDDDNYEKFAKFANDNNLIVKEIQSKNGERLFQIVEPAPLTLEQNQSNLRTKREIECFRIINRGKLWYDTLTETQLQELRTWYVAWLNVTDTLQIPTKPSWLKEL